MSDPKLGERFATPSSSKLAQILLDLRGVEGPVGICNLQQSEIQLWSETYRQDENATSGDVDQSSQQDTCNCRKSKCLKLYCQCFAARATCSSSCRCVSCENKPDNAATRDAAVSLILERNPNAFDSKYRPTASSVAMSSTFTAISSIAHKNGCRCRKSMCLKKYCECFQGGVPCSSICTCLTCQNTGPASHVVSTVTEMLPLDRSHSIGSLAPTSDALLLSQRSRLSDQSIFASDSGLSGENNLVFKTDKVSISDPSGASSDATSRPPLVPSHKRKRESDVNSSSVSGRENASVEAELRPDVEEAHSGATFHPTPLTPNMSRAQQQQLLRELLFQELQSQGILSSPLTSFLTTNCPGLMQSQGTTIDDINNLFKNGTYAGVSTPAGPGTLLSYTPNTAAAAENLASAATSASPNTFSIATALALLAANAQAQAIAAHQQGPTSSGSTGICEGKSPQDFHHRSSVPASALAVESARRVQQQAAYDHDTISSLSKLDCHAYTPVAAVQQVSDHSTLSQGLTDEETLGTGGSSLSDETCSSRSDACNSSLLGLPAKALFGNDGLPSPDAIEAPRRVTLPLSKVGGYGVTRIEIDGVCNENASPNTVPSADRHGLYESLWR